MAESADYTRSLGKVVRGLLSIETALRSFLHHVNDEASLNAMDLTALSVGDVLPNSALTKSDSLGQLIEKYNIAVIGANQGTLRLDAALFELRDTLDFGRVWGGDGNPPLRMVRFSRPANGLVTCIDDQLMDEHWLDTQAGRVSVALEMVRNAAQAIHPQHSPW
jgi:hypothetical protein